MTAATDIVAKTEGQQGTLYLCATPITSRVSGLPSTTVPARPGRTPRGGLNATAISPLYSAPPGTGPRRSG